MGFNLIMNFRGLCGFVPVEEPLIEKGGTRRSASMWVLLPNRSRIVAGRNQPSVHTAVLKVSPQNIYQAAIDVDRLDLVWGLNRVTYGYDLQILPGGKPILNNTLKYCAYDPVEDRITQNPASVDYWQSFYWVAGTQPACQGVGYDNGGCIDGEHLKPPPLTDPTRLAARLFVNSGMVCSSKLAAVTRGGTTKLLLWKFHSFSGSGGGKRKVMAASEVSVTMWIDEAFVELRGKSLGKDDGAASLQLAPQGNEKSVYVIVLNEESDAIVEANEKPPSFTKGRPRVRDRIYEAFFDLAKDVGMGVDERPMPVFAGYKDVPPKPDIPTMVSPPCSPGRYPLA